MKKALAFALALAFAGTANAGFYCKVEGYSSGLPAGASVATSKYLEWHYGSAFPDTSAFPYTTKDVVCFADNYILYAIIPTIQGFPHVKGVEADRTNTTAGVVYRGDEARFLIDNLKSVPRDIDGNLLGASGPAVDKTDFIASVKP